MEYTQDLKRAYKTSAILYIAFMLSLVIYLVVFEILKAQITDFQGFLEKIDFPWLRYAFFTLGLIQIFLIKFIRETATKSLTTVDVRILTNHLQRMSMLSAALCEVPVILGWVLFFLSGNSNDFYVLLIMSFVLFVMYFPRYANWEDWIKSKISH
ncbi:MAG: hypothetical protein JSV17_06390 [Candidatus Aminicenantes bacterium]|nr:MAG: hypothetical protein JSV17_06390 [Candidatus Aminicenantes bacterium]